MTAKTCPRPRMRTPTACICPVDRDPSEGRFSTCGVPCASTSGTHWPDYIREQIRLYDAWSAEARDG